MTLADPDLHDLRLRSLQAAMQAHGRGDWAEAGRGYRGWLEREPDDPDALHLLGVLEAQQGQLEVAARLIERAIEVKPDESMFHNNLGNVRVEQGRLPDAEPHYLRAVQLEPQRVDAANNLGVVLSRIGRSDQATAILQQVVKMAPGFADARLNLVQHCFRTGDYGNAIQHCLDGLVTDPGSNPMRRLLGAAYSALGMDTQATELYQRWLADEPDNPVARHHLQACLGADIPERASDGYVSTVFDQFAASFDSKLAKLEYRAPEHIAAWVDAQAGAVAAEDGAARWRVLDLGCGTGLVGPLVRRHARELVGVDLSAGMLQKAAARQVYDALHQGELVAFLEAQSEPAELLVCADTLCYFGVLDDFAAAARRALVPGGHLVATVEAHPEPDDAEPPYRLHIHGRYSHASGYVQSALAATGFETVAIKAVPLRNEAGRPVQGWLVAARAADAVLPTS